MSDIPFFEGVTDVTSNTSNTSLNIGDAEEALEELERQQSSIQQSQPQVQPQDL